MVKQNSRHWTLCPIATKRNITKQIYVCIAVYELLTALLKLELPLPEEEIPKHVHLMHYQFNTLSPDLRAYCT